ncbi:hypothetical protein LX15_004840 [Streptoalloteichus tenebrarius]|uniref:Regulatory protein n=1 Tax=Streptoalloteichus tenebrarius (strain ATCC 17920 / DSM 40477 / JCM 4838 / CBS 697.72 / NBRC 16177 / NCIMB 11028 / NRRL B-12390 / A12253. 1 / ISP 5477) TaxID=1933 RepID=A0ABT1I046_STRSD|nr:DUF5685 family protein [Streptoalloteichus tenebrarius]MCP2261120.1 hypothetical protein [Streptoalloteichus tenebrarius]BFF03971.1 DUF5685 family protein [Streptoalloteichus tenebrarius]
MFGIIRPCRNRLSDSLRAAWLAHLCGLCLALRDDHGHLARLVTNYDGLVVSALVEAQIGGRGRRRSAGPCALRGLRGAEVAHGEGARLAASVSLVLASAKVEDHVADRDGVFARRPVAGTARVVARRWAEQGARTGRSLGFDTAVLVEAVRRQPEVEARAGRGTPLLEVTEPTETATAAAFAHTAVLSGRPGNQAALAEAGRLFGRVAHLLDAVEDLAEDERFGAWNPLLVTGADPAEARRLCEDAVTGIALALADAEFADDRLVRALLVDELQHAVHRVFGRAGHSSAPGHPDPHRPEYPQHGIPGHPPASDHPNPAPPGQTTPTPPPPGKPPRHARHDDAERGCLCWRWPKLTRPYTTRTLVPGCFALLYECGTCQQCFRDPFPGAWTGKWREACCDECDCCDCDCCSCDC